MWYRPIHSARKIYPCQFFREPGFNPEDMNCAMVTKHDRLKILKGKPNKLFTPHTEKLVEQRQQWCELLADPVSRDDIWEAAPGSFGMLNKEHRECLTIAPGRAMLANSPNGVRPSSGKSHAD
jgi:hypothetical protein